MEQDSYIHLARPLTTTVVQPPQAPLNVVIHSQVLLSILDHASRRSFEQDRVIGTLLGVRSEDGTEVEIRNCFAVGHNESQVQVEVDMDYHKAMYNLHLKANSKETLVGWYATSPELNTFSALIQNFYASNGDGTYPHPAVHLTLATMPGKDICCRTYISSPVGVTPDRAADSCLFLPVPYGIRYNDAERSGLELLSRARNNDSMQSNIITDIQSLENGLEEVLVMIDRVNRYVSQILNDETPFSFAIGQHLINSLSLAPNIDVNEIEKLFNDHLQDVLLVSYLANVVRTQIKLFSNINSSTMRT